MDATSDNGLLFTFSDTLAPTPGMGGGGQVGAWRACWWAGFQ